MSFAKPPEGYHFQHYSIQRWVHVRKIGEPKTICKNPGKLREYDEGWVSSTMTENVCSRCLAVLYKMKMGLLIKQSTLFNGDKWVMMTRITDYRWIQVDPLGKYPV